LQGPNPLAPFPNELLHECRLAHADLATDEDCLPLAALDVLPERFQCTEFALPPHEGHFGGKLDHRWRDYGRAARQALIEGAHLRQGLGVQFVL
jgi:hypothetical protein